MLHEDQDLPVADSAEAAEQPDGASTWQVQRRDSRSRRLISPAANQLLRAKVRHVTYSARLPLSMFDDMDDMISPSLALRDQQSQLQAQPQGQPQSQPKDQTKSQLQGTALGAQGQSCNAPGTEDSMNTARSSDLSPLKKASTGRARRSGNFDLSNMRDAEGRSRQGSSAGSGDEGHATADYCSMDGSLVPLHFSSEASAGWASPILEARESTVEGKAEKSRSSLTHPPTPLCSRASNMFSGDDRFRDALPCLFDFPSAHQRSRSGVSKNVHQQQHHHHQPRPQTSEPVPPLRAPSTKPGSQVSPCTSDQFPSLPAVSQHSGLDMTRPVAARGTTGSRHGATLHLHTFSAAEPGGISSDLAGSQWPVSWGAPLPAGFGRNSRRHTDLTVTSAKASGPIWQHVADTEDHGNEDHHPSCRPMSGELSTDDEAALSPRHATQDKAGKPDARLGTLLPTARAAANGVRRSLQTFSSRR